MEDRDYNKPKRKKIALIFNIIIFTFKVIF